MKVMSRTNAMHYLSSIVQVTRTTAFDYASSLPSLLIWYKITRKKMWGFLSLAYEYLKDRVIKRTTDHISEFLKANIKPD